jgi:DNA-binding GntR family transcriptional regulator
MGKVGKGMATATAINVTSLREQVYHYLRHAIKRGDLTPGAHIDQNRVASALGISRQPLRDALIQLEAEGFVRILPRRGVVVRELTLEDIRHLYEIIGALEGAAVVAVGARLDLARLTAMRSLNADMVRAIDDVDFDRYYELNVDFHETFLTLCDNADLVRTVRISKQRLYDFPRVAGFVPEWELRSTEEHAELVDLLEQGSIRSAGDYLRDVHWSFDVQQRFVLQYYFGAVAGKG